jgi:hypothetical protein
VDHVAEMEIAGGRWSKTRDDAAVDHRGEHREIRVDGLPGQRTKVKGGKIKNT